MIWMSDLLETRTGLPDALRILVTEYPRDIWTSHHNFDGLTRFWLSRHLEFRRGLALMQSQTRALLDGAADEQPTLTGLARITRFMADSLHGHHHMEDAHYFPLLISAEKRLAAGFELLDADHHALDRHIATMETHAASLFQADTPLADRLGPVDQHLSDFERFLDRHLTDEEDLIVPIILKHGPVHP